MSVLQEILEWSYDRPIWQRDALRRLVLNGELLDDDADALTDICKSAYGLGEQPDVTPLSEDDVPVNTAGDAPVSLLSIFHHRGVNALAEGQTLRFGPHLTVVYGDNAAGKTGYIRILKSACRARSQEQILGNVTSGATPFSPTISIKYKVGTELQPREWTGNSDDNSISRVSVFDTQSAAVYLTEKTDVAFRPFGLDLFDKLVKACRAVRTKLENEQRALTSSGLSVLQGQIPEGTAVAGLLANISLLTKAETVEALAQLSPEENSRLAELESSLIDLQFREAVARRLVEEAKDRQVIVFTHDVVYLLFLKQFAEELEIEQFDQHIRQLSMGAGVCEEELPWVALGVKKKIGYIKNAHQAADKLFRNGHQDAYEKDAKHLYGLLREAWERALEESSSLWNCRALPPECSNAAYRYGRRYPARGLPGIRGRNDKMLAMAARS